jgi:gluconate 5-dehydrogenase
MSDPTLPLAGQTALVTGGGRGLGRTIAEWLGRDGASLILSGRDAADLDQAVADLRAAGITADAIPADLSDPADAHRLGREATARGPLHILVNNAGMSIRGHFWEVSDADWEYQVNVNQRAPFIVSQHAARGMIGQGIRGRIVHVSTIGAHLCHKDGLVYDAAKAAVEAMTRNMAYELGPHGISVNCVVPGAVPERPGIAADLAGWPRTASLIPLGRAGRAEDIAAAVRFFCRPESAWTTGQCLLVDGGHATYLVE